MRDAVICEPIRTPVGRYNGALKDRTAQELGAIVVSELLRRTGLDPSTVDDLVLGHCYPTMDAPAIGRVVALDAGLGVGVPGVQLDRRCGSGLQAVLNAAMAVQTGAQDLVLAGGVESMSNAGTDALTRGRTTAGGVRYPVPGGMLETAENLRREYSVPREEQDELALRSHERAVAAQVSGRFADELVPVGDFVADEHPRPGSTLEKLASLKPVMDVEGATVTAGNASGQNDGAALCVVTHPERAAELGLRPLARLVSWASAGVEPARMGIGPVPSSARALRIAGLKLDDMDLIELNEAFAAQVLAVTREWGVTDFDRINVNGSGIALGHPVGATGARILATMLRELERRDGRYALETMCIGGGQGLAAVFERVS
ncbi:acetyl-CoA C-acetyltransferase [Lentzea sp. NBRC 102530]|uniref:acetyl-CoA C-acetyltransferase n=1 Tax=Lentzea sp. NBRC 102530 TaxID=3032201 RepID=UPI0024A590CB|nr:acetyl-CoA C-acetyltransferase [Lentzea sp. NBRC 102530]GLY46904.1 acetyl-CoA acetyltransferase [Lentzea sp. NBRC 102530]